MLSVTKTEDRVSQVQSMKMATSRSTLTLQKKYEVIDMAIKNPLIMSVHKLAEHFACGS